MRGSFGYRRDCNPHERRQVRKFLYWFGAVAAVVVVVLIVGIGYLAYVGSGADKESKLYADSAIVAITTHWNPAELQSRETPELMASVDTDQLKLIFGQFRRLGNLVKYGGSKGSATILASVDAGSKVTANYVGSATYENGAASIELLLQKIGGAWMINGFHVNSPVLFQKPVQQL